MKPAAKTSQEQLPLTAVFRILVKRGQQLRGEDTPQEKARPPARPEKLRKGETRQP